MSGHESTPPSSRSWGWRTVISRNSDDFTTNSNTIFRETFVLAGIEREEQLKLARETGFVLGQGRALKKPYFPPRVLRAPR